MTGSLSGFADLSTALIADACVRLAAPLRLAPAGISSTMPAEKVAGRALPARHHGSVDIFLEALSSATPGDVLVIDNGGRTDEACVGDLVALEAASAGIVAVVIWGLHRDSADLRAIALPVFSYGRLSAGPTRLDARHRDALATARIGEHLVSADDVVFADDDGVLFVAAELVEDVIRMARKIWHTEREQADRIRGGDTLRSQTDFAEYMRRRAADPSYTFRQHLRAIGGAIEE